MGSTVLACLVACFFVTVRIQTNGGDVVYWETTINSFLDDYRLVEGIMIALSGR
ncbi:hypothetical protein Hanom_Chr04g00343201 [Helianthus anomalus]